MRVRAVSVERLQYGIIFSLSAFSGYPCPVLWTTDVIFLSLYVLCCGLLSLSPLTAWRLLLLHVVPLVNVRRTACPLNGVIHNRYIPFSYRSRSI